MFQSENGGKFPARWAIAGFALECAIIANQRGPAPHPYPPLPGNRARHPPTMISTSRIIASFAAFALLGGCGLKGPLTLPPPEPDEATTSIQPSKPVSAKELGAKSKSAPTSKTDQDKPSSPSNAAPAATPYAQ